MALISPPGLPAPKAFDCTPSSLLASAPCLDCTSETEMLAVLVGIIALATDQNVQDVLKQSSCFSCPPLSAKQIVQIIATIAGNDLLGEELSEQQVLDAIRCIRRCSNRPQLIGALLYLLCHSIEFAPRT
jgi:hypothetical protein